MVNLLLFQAINNILTVFQANEHIRALHSASGCLQCASFRKCGRAVEGTGLENRRPERVPEFESLRFRQIKKRGYRKVTPFFFWLLVQCWYIHLVYFPIQPMKSVIFSYHCAILVLRRITLANDFYRFNRTSLLFLFKRRGCGQSVRMEHVHSMARIFCLQSVFISCTLSTIALSTVPCIQPAPL